MASSSTSPTLKTFPNGLMAIPNLLDATKRHLDLLRLSSSSSFRDRLSAPQLRIGSTMLRLYRRSRHLCLFPPLDWINPLVNAAFIASAVVMLALAVWRCPITRHHPVNAQVPPLPHFLPAPSPYSLAHHCCLKLPLISPSR
ncbi:hypothetical protein R3P38DRAFT_3297039 [Favolaschia claudopus]|uniref:Uncharacterized protein n=1 Tax=Favolaschia claudopus TaxID=2862362 RepID=A0AAV9Z7X4_9AGAR